ncbi:hypothetical protein DSO57_1004381 [Entomophthora muscae]|uniref:Uncharacterized protein n=1 Tax=Entomophthora muscae TaxID=34485 RepID=A0ACC2U6J5_9FUNG|nr:hypothetical protein DSO57_1004381 [Entomophthora muscae]
MLPVTRLAQTSPKKNEDPIEIISVSPSVEKEDPNPITHLVFGFWGDFFDFLMVTDVFSLGVGIIIGTIFTDVINSFVTDILTPPIGLLLGNAQLQNLFFVIKQGNTKKKLYETVKQALDDGAVTINFGIFLLALMRFLLVTLILFWCIQAFQILKKEQERLDIPNKISQSAQKVTELVENIAGNTPKNDTKPLDMPQSPTHKGSVSPDLPNSAPPKEEKSPGLLDFVGSSDFNPTSPKLQPTHEKKFSCIFCLKPLSPNVIRCPYCTSILNPCRYHCAQEDLKISK